jgi:predicted DCC family thiol-disulfide oxidoreductase YuxK
LPNWGWVNALHVVLRGVRDFVYDLIARNRYHIFGRQDACDLSRVPPTDRIIFEATPLGE